MPSGDEDNVKVAVRVRPFNDREEKRDARCIVKMQGPSTSIYNPDNEGDKRTFTFDYSYWSHDGFQERSDGYLEGTNDQYAEQQTVYNDLGVSVLDKAWEGYNCSLFAYGQTGSGKSYSMVGFGANKGIVPIVAENLFNSIDGKDDTNKEFQVSVSMLEIYCEKVRDLLDAKGHKQKGGLKVREHQKKGFYVEGLIAAPVDSYEKIAAKLDEGNKNRTIAATNMNATSSRAHTIFQINFQQLDKATKTSKTSIINLVDLAGSERHKDAGNTGDRLKEGIVINQSLTTLGRCIAALAETQKTKKKGNVVPYRDSILTSLLKNALGGNSKTIMIAAISPADINYEESLSTLRFADRTKQIKTKAIVNESASDRLIRELKEENARLQQMLEAGGVVHTTEVITDNEELEALRAQLEANKREMEDRELSWQERLQMESTRSKGSEDYNRYAAEKRKSAPHFWNLNEDPALSDVIVHFVEPGDRTLGNGKTGGNSDIVLKGLAIQKDHCRLRNMENKKIILIPMTGSRVLINGKECSNETEIFHNDRIHFGGNHLYVFSHPYDLMKKARNNERIVQITYEMAQSEIAQNMGMMGAGPRSKEDMILEEDLVKILPMIAQGNAMAEELNKFTLFEPVLVAPQARGLKSGPTEICVKMTNQTNDNEFLWDKNKFINRYYGMQELYQNYTDGYANWDVPKDRDPFYESPDTEVLIGNVHVYLQSLAYMVEIDEQLHITDYKGNERGYLKLDILPCTAHGKELVGEFVEGPDELVGKGLNFKVKVNESIGLPRKFISSRCRYRFFGQDRDAVTMEISGSNPHYGHEKMFSFSPVTKAFVEYMKDNAMIIQVFGKQSDKRLTQARMPKGTFGNLDYKDRCEDLEMKLERVNALIDDANDTGSKSVSVRSLASALGDGDHPVHNGYHDDDIPSSAKPKRGGSGKKKRSRSRGKH